jgi:inosose dehydratase
VKGETGLRTVFHHHGGGYVETPEEVERLLDLTDAELVGLVLDTGHYAFGTGFDALAANAAVLAALDTLGTRIWHVHFKDCEPDVAALTRRENMDYFEAVGAGVFCELGKGCVDFPAVVARLNARGYAGAIVVEQDVLPGMGTPRESAQRNRDYLKSIGI